MIELVLFLQTDVISLLHVFYCKANFFYIVIFSLNAMQMMLFLIPMDQIEPYCFTHQKIYILCLLAFIRIG